MAEMMRPISEKQQGLHTQTEARKNGGSMTARESKEADFTIVQKPVYISLECPHCESSLQIGWNEVNPPSYWGDYWEDIECPECEGEIELGEYDVD